MTLVKDRRYLARFLGMSGTDPLYGVKASDEKPSLLVTPNETIGAHSCGKATVISLPCAEKTSLESAWVGQEIDVYNASIMKRPQTMRWLRPGTMTSAAGWG